MGNYNNINMKKTAAIVLLALLGNSGDVQATRLLKTQRISADSFSNVGEEDSTSLLMKMGHSTKSVQSLAQSQE